MLSSILSPILGKIMETVAKLLPFLFVYNKGKKEKERELLSKENNKAKKAFKLVSNVRDAGITRGRAALRLSRERTRSRK